MSDRAVSGGLAVALALCLVAPQAVVVTVVAAAATVIVAVRFRRGALHCRRRSWRVAGLGVALIGVAAMSMVASDPGIYGAELVLGMLAVPLVALAVGGIRDRALVLTAMWRGSCVGAVASGVFALGQVVAMGSARATGGTGNAIAFGDASLVLVIVAVSLRSATEAGRTSAGVVMTWCASVLGSCAIALSGARGAWVAVPVVALVMAGTQPGVLRRVPVATASAVTAVVLLVIGRSQLARGGEAFQDVAGYAGSGSAGPAAATNVGLRLESWRTAVEAFLHRPVFGVGWGNLPERFVADVASGRRARGIAEFDHAHNVFVDAAASAGVVGLVALVMLFALPARWFVVDARHSEPSRIACGSTGASCLAAYAVFGLTDAVFHSPLPVVVFSLVVGGLVAALPADSVRIAPPVRRPHLRSAADLLAEYPSGLVGFHVHGNLS